jgi:hypothetical protein
MTAAYIIGATTITRVWLALGGPEPKRGRLAREGRTV